MSDIKQTLKEFFDILDTVEETDEGREFRPVYISSCRVMATQKLGELIKQMKEFVGDDTKVVIDRKEYESLLEDSVWLAALESAGVDNWEGYDEARIILKEMKEEN